LDEIGIGRPSTFSTIVETIKDRGYVKCGDVPGTPYESTAFKYDCKKGPTIVATKKTKMMCEEKNKLIITPLGIETIKFLIGNFDVLFNYEYTAKMEASLDKIAVSTMEPTTITQRSICADCLKDIKNCISTINDPIINEANVPSNDITEVMKKGVIDGVPVYAKRGKYGPYIQYGERNIPVKSIVNITMDEIMQLLATTNGPTNGTTNGSTNAPTTNSKIFREINGDISIRKGKYAKPYIYYKTAEMDKPVFTPIPPSMTISWETCDPNEFVAWYNDQQHTPLAKGPNKGPNKGPKRGPNNGISVSRKNGGGAKK
jgi:DNA topoisomerase-1